MTAASMQNKAAARQVEASQARFKEVPKKLRDWEKWYL